MITKKPSLKEEDKQKNPSSKTSEPELFPNSDKNLAHFSNSSTKTQTSTPVTKKSKTKITVKYDVGFSNTIYVRGRGANLTWDKGAPLKNVKADEWVWETEIPFTSGEFKVLINDKTYEGGENHQLTYGASIYYTPHF